MSSFAPAHDQNSNSAGLDELLTNIIDRPRNWQSSTHGSQDASDRVDRSGHAESEHSIPALAVPQRRSSVRFSQLHTAASSPYLWWSLNRPSSQNGARSSLSRPRTRTSHRSDEFAITAVPTTSSKSSQNNKLKQLEIFDEKSFKPRFHASPSFWSVRAVSDQHFAAHSRFTTINKEGRLVPKAPTQRSQRSTLSLPLYTFQSNSSLNLQLSEFPSHPGVRPHVRDCDVLGEANGLDDDNEEYPNPFALALIILGICLSVFIVSVNRNVVATAIPDITARFHSYEDIGWYGSSYLLTASAFQPLYGRIYMAFDTKWTFLLALITFEVGSLICGISPNSATLVVGRAVQGLGSAGILTGSFVIGTHSVRLDKRPVLFAGVGMLFGVGALCGPMIGGVLTDLVTWRWCFYLNLPVGSVTFIFVLLCFKPQRRSDAPLPSFLLRLRRLDWIGNTMLLAACTMLFLALQYSQERYSWSSARCIGLIVGCGVTLLIFIAWMFWKGQDALIPVHIVRQRTVAASCGAAFFIYGALLLHSYYLPIWFQAVKGASAIQSGVNMVPYMVVNAFFSLFAGIFVSKNGLFTPPAIIGCAIGTVGSGLLATVQPDTSTAKWAGYEVLVSAGLGMAIQQGFSAVQTALPLHEVPIGTAAVVACQSIGGAIFVSVGNTLLQDHLLNADNANTIPGVNIRAVIELGATRFRDTIPSESLPALVALYNDSLQGALIAAVPLCGCAFLCSLCMEWRSVRKGQPSGSETGTGTRTGTVTTAETTIDTETKSKSEV